MSEENKAKLANELEKFIDEDTVSELDHFQMSVKSLQNKLSFELCFYENKNLNSRTANSTSSE